MDGEHQLRQRADLLVHHGLPVRRGGVVIHSMWGQTSKDLWQAGVLRNMSSWQKGAAYSPPSARCGKSGLQTASCPASLRRQPALPSY